MTVVWRSVVYFITGSRALVSSRVPISSQNTGFFVTKAKKAAVRAELEAAEAALRDTLKSMKVVHVSFLRCIDKSSHDVSL